MFDISFHLTDKCNLKCDGCHWFSEEINYIENTIPYTTYLDFIERNKEKIKSVRLSGGEPTLYKDFILLVNSIPKPIKVTVNTNGTNLDILKEIKRPINLDIGLNREVGSNFKFHVSRLRFKTRFITYNEKLTNPANVTNQLYNNLKLDKTIIGLECNCKPKLIRFGVDGFAYNCENGLRTKKPELRLDLSLFDGNLDLKPFKCVIKDSCLSNFIHENDYELI